MMAQKPNDRETSIVTTLTIELTEETPAYYINFAEVTNTPYDFSIIGARLPAKPSVEQIEDTKKSGKLVVESNVVIVFPVGMIPGLIKALTKQKEMYEKQLKMTIADLGEDNE
jgi:hypothetical protein